MKKIGIVIPVILVIAIIGAYFYGFTKINRQVTALMSADREYSDGDWKELYAYEVGKQAFIYGYPALYYSSLRYYMVEKPRGAVSMPIDQYYHSRVVASPENLYGGSPNRETPYSLAFVNLTDEPAVISVPENAENRYYCVQLTDFYSDTYGYIGTRATGNKKGDYLIVGPNFKDKIPESFAGVYHSPTNWTFVLNRTFTDGTPEDLQKMAAMQDQYKITKWNRWQNPNLPFTENRDVIDALEPKDDPLNAFKTMNAAMIENPPPVRDEALMDQFALVGLGSKGVKDLDSLDESIKRGLRRAVVDANALLKNVSLNYASITNNSKTVNNWIYGAKNWGRMGETHDFLGRAGTQALAGITEHYIEEVVKIRAFVDENGNRLNGDNKYTIHFEKNQIPVAKIYWSITAYNDDFNLIPVEAQIYSIGSLVKTLKYNADGSIDFYVQAERPSDDKASNWLPVKKGENFNLFLRAYLPNEDLLTQNYVPPPIKKVN